MDNKRILICRLGAIGDSLITTPLVSLLHSQGFEIYYLTSEQGQQILKENPKVKKIIPHIKDSVPSDSLDIYFKAVAQAHECERWIDLCESIEVNLALHPSDPRYKYPKYERAESCDKNYYEETIKISSKKIGMDILGWNKKPLKKNPEQPNYNPEMFFTEIEDAAMRQQFAGFKGAFTVVIGLSGSARQKTYPFTLELIQRLTKEIPNIQFITVGDEACQILEYNLSPLENVLCTSGIWSIRESILATKYADLVISPDTGLLHGAGCFDTPKIGLITSTTIENITKHFINDFSIEAKDVGCAPCFYLIYDADTQCNLGKNKACLCMDKGIPLNTLVDRVLEVFYKFPAKKVIESGINILEMPYV